MLKIYTFFLLFIACNITAQAQCGVYAYITNSGDNTLSVIDVNTHTVTTTIPVGAFPTGISSSPDGGKLYVINGSGDVSVVTTATNTVTATIGVVTGLLEGSISPDGSLLYLPSQNDNTVNVVNTATNMVITTIPVGAFPGGITISPDGSRIYVANEDDATVSVINTADNTVITTIGVDMGPVGMAITPDGNSVYVANRANNTVSVISTATNTVIATIPVGSGPIGIAISPDGNKVYVANSSDNTINVIDATTNSVTATVPVGTYPLGVAITPDGSWVYIANNVDNTVSVLNATNNMVIATVPVGSGPFALGKFIINTCNGALPLSFLSFEAQWKKGNNVLLQWKTANEVNTGNFMIQRSTDGISFVAIGKVPANNPRGNYQYTDQLLPQDINNHTTLYYRLKEIDRDGKAVYSRITLITLSAIQESSFSLAPNPAVNTICIKGDDLKTIEIMDNTGRICVTKNAINSTRIDVDISPLTPSIYFIRITDKIGRKSIKKLVVK